MDNNYQGYTELCGYIAGTDTPMLAGFVDKNKAQIGAWSQSTKDWTGMASVWSRRFVLDYF
ncbi:hypothetical protein BDB00DRAFT_871723 [Zychaea mexicana]|uniref:uncharacterized protein n=1 Tax=Zychaea mexicana TaxID=64656 RepID=UPI0022FDB810|nr:uncharacterized protein BDB00DRAFT_871723 [Zychaea mexicana]KAI9494197.1 hypothetical protein BDB00DRAFT_871723 [Zychaea mexicana]